MPINKAAKVLKVYPGRITIFNYWIARAHDADIIENMTQVGFGKTSTKKGHHYITTMIDLKERRVLYACQGKDSGCINKSVKYLQENK
ncbi:hypothetical protein A9Q93_01115 [Nonlabens dokdonensis]|uniref:Transposase n=1 Tax=Nonlabens dokdonensis TaxID=328515 RepID=A0A1Z8BFL8_9FLAO|nr:hypothetical protein [Nonlabens dokdonensis]OUS21372.1 hypothetical protein A9Q93_01115 [Nonlabens dokdonensis]